MAYTDIDKSDDYFNTVLYTGNGGTQSITGVNFKPDFVWLKNRDNGAYAHQAYDIIRGATQRLHPNTPDSEATLSNGLTSFNTDGFSVGSDGGVNNGSEKFVSWNWLGSNTTASNTDGDITSTVSANTTSGFSVVSYTGNGSTNQTIGHGLGAVPSFIIVKQRNTSRNWPTYMKVAGNGVAFLDVGDAWDGGPAYSNYWYISGMTSNTFGISNNDNTNASGGTYIAYCFAQKKGFSKFGEFTGNGSSDGSFVHCGFKPAWVLVKNKNAGGYNWTLHDNKRNEFNLTNRKLEPNTSNAEDTVYDVMDFYSNGFKCKTADPGINASGSVYFYYAFAENPFVTSTGIPACAR